MIPDNKHRGSTSNSTDDENLPNETHKNFGTYLPRTSQDIILWLIGPFLGIVLFTIGKYAKMDDPLNIATAFTSVFVGMALTQIITFQKQTKIIERETGRVAEILSNTISNKVSEIHNEVSKFTKSQRHRFEISRVQNNELRRMLKHSSERSHFIKNTYIGLHSVTGTGVPHSDEFVELYNIFLSKAGNRWIDVTSVGDFLNGRFAKIGNGTDPLLGSHQLIILDKSFPTINYVIFGSEIDDLNEVYFGWIMVDQTKIEIYRSVDKKLVALFNSHFQMFDSMSNRSSLEIMYNQSSEVRFEQLPVYRLNGFWVSISDSVGATNLDSIRKISIIHFFYENSDWKLEGYTFDRKTLEVEQRIHADKCILMDLSFVYNYMKINVFTNKRVSGLGRYLLSRSPVDSATGFYIDDNNPKKFVTAARKILTEPDARLITTLFSRMLHDDPYADLHADLSSIFERSVAKIARRGLSS